MDLGISTYLVGESISGLWKSNKPAFSYQSIFRSDQYPCLCPNSSASFPTAVGNALKDLLMAFRIINSSSPIEYPWSCLTHHMAFVALHFLGFCFNSFPHHIWRRAFPVEALSPDRPAKECN